jgi:transaldolase
MDPVLAARIGLMERPLRIKIFADGADIDEMMRLAADPRIKGFTTNPALMRRAGVADYEAFGRQALAAIPDRPVSLEVFADDFPTMERQARAIAGWGANAYVKIPITDTAGNSAAPLVARLSADGIALNVTALLTLDQVCACAAALDPTAPAIVSVFAGRIADTGVDPVPVMAEALRVLAARPRAELLWASPRELLNIVQADAIGCPIVTVTADLLAKLSLIGKDLTDYSRETVEMFRRDALAAGYSIRTYPMPAAPVMP